jgi:hypothetical protein
VAPGQNPDAMLLDALPGEGINIMQDGLCCSLVAPYKACCAAAEEVRLLPLHCSKSEDLGMTTAKSAQVPDGHCQRLPPT